ncbi:phage portal protein [Herbiconiux sp. VKM Ac-2851]|uniref:phage portal protein n=1 Tax=Herbiconiux sp. VKM Ac-2851 TaxID=2739025 RepID=UPI0015671F32|nr:phage portal protein [Herbiconiux sp. VKM Ac-2851]NQX34048.1 phage portal protein [Herbiconiux sp. VKM Ac-2851]
MFRRARDLSNGPSAIASPFTNGSATLNQVLLSEVFGSDVAERLPFTRTEAMSIPAVAKARNLIVTTGSKFPLRALDANGPVATQPTFLYRTDSEVTPFERLAFTIDDLIFYGISLWQVDRGAAGQITRANWLPMSRWTITEGVVLIDEQPVPESTYILINSHWDGLLNVATRTLRAARDLENSWAARVRNPVPVTVLSLDSEYNLDPEETEALLTQWRTLRRSPEGAVGYTPAGMTMETFGEVPTDLFIEGRNAIRTDIGSFLNVPTSLLDGSLSTASLTYSTAEGNRNRFYDETLPMYLDAISARLSMDDVVPRGQRVAFDLSEAYALTPTSTGPVLED